MIVGDISLQGRVPRAPRRSHSFQISVMFSAAALGGMKDAPARSILLPAAPSPRRCAGVWRTGARRSAGRTVISPEEIDPSGVDFSDVSSVTGSRIPD